MMKPHICLTCRKSFKRPEKAKKLCSDCGNNIHVAHPNFSPPKSTDEKAWKVVEFLLERGFDFSGWVQEVGGKNASLQRPGYPTTMTEAEQFVKKWNPPPKA